MELKDKKIELSPIYDTLFSDLTDCYNKKTVDEIKKNDIEKNKEEELNIR